MLIDGGECGGAENEESDMHGVLEMTCLIIILLRPTTTTAGGLGLINVADAGRYVVPTPGVRSPCCWVKNDSGVCYFPNGRLHQ